LEPLRPSRPPSRNRQAGARVKAQYDQAVEDVVRDVLERHPDISAELLCFAMGRALGRLEGKPEGVLLARLR
jgi:hypothetical protein